MSGVSAFDPDSNFYSVQRIKIYLARFKDDLGDFTEDQQ